MFNNTARPVIWTIILVLLAVTLPSQSRAQNAGTNIAVVNMQQILKESKAAQNIQEQLDKQRGAFQKEVTEQEKDLKDTEKKLAEVFETLSAEELAAKKKDFENKLLDARKLVQKRRGALEDAAGVAMKELRAEITAVVSNIADEGQYDLVLTRQNVVIVQESHDITAQVLKALDKKDSKIKLKVAKD